MAAEKRKRMLIAVVAGSLAALLFFLGFSSRSQGVAGPVQAAPALMPEVVAQTKLSAGTKLGPENTALVMVPAPPQGLPADAITTVAQASGKFLKLEVAARTPLLGSMLVATPSETGSSLVKQAPLDIKPGDVAVSIPFDQAKGVGGYVQPEDHLDILVDAGDGQVHFGFQDVRVLRVGAVGAASTDTASLLVLELPRDKAAALTYLVENKSGKTSLVRYLLRPHDAYNKGGLSNSDPITDANLLQHLDH